MPTKSNSRASGGGLNRFRVPLIAGIAAFAVALSGGGAWAYWTTSATAGGSVKTSTAAVSYTPAQWPQSLYLPSEPTSTTPFTVTNSGQTAGTATITFSSSAPMASHLSVTAWTVTSTAACTATATPGSNPATGKWGQFSTSTPKLNPGASTVYCVRTVIDDWKKMTSDAGSQTIQPSIQVLLDADGWKAEASGTASQTTAGMYPAVPQTENLFGSGKSRWYTISPAGASAIPLKERMCLDVAGSGSSGAGVLSYKCHESSNQRWEFIPVSATDSSLLVTLRPRHINGYGSRLTSTSNNGQAITAFDTAGAKNQQWYVQRIPGKTPTRYQLVSAATGRCLSLYTTQSEASATTVPCNESAAQLEFNFESLTLTTAATSVTLGLGGSKAPTALSLKRTSGPTPVATANVEDKGFTFAITALTDKTTGTYRIVDGSGNVYWDNIQIHRDGSNVNLVGVFG